MYCVMLQSLIQSQDIQIRYVKLQSLIQSQDIQIHCVKLQSLIQSQGYSDALCKAAVTHSM